MQQNTRREGVISVSEITNSIKLLLENHIGLVSVEGEVSNYKPHYSGHKYFTLKDAGAQLSCTMWKSRPVNFDFVDGQKIIVTGTISVYPPRGNYQLDVISAIPYGTGDLYRAFEVLKQKLDQAGYFDTDIKKELPEMPLRIGVSTSPTGAAVRDIISTIQSRFPIVEIYLRPTIVQGDNAAADIVNAITELSNSDVDVIIVGRGGGSIEDLWAYNTEPVANAIYDCSIPIISAVGHETDFSIADFVSDVRAATPTAAAILATPITQLDIQNNLYNYESQMTQAMQSLLQKYYDMLATFSVPRLSKQILDTIHFNFQLLDNETDDINRSMLYYINNTKHSLDKYEGLIKAASPTAPLNRGYALLKYGNEYINRDESITQYDTIEVVRKNESVQVKIVQHD
ncbi:MAG: exodeoxyribonuclease VII large subunit [Ignavibacteria bacterium]|jgi:exodeoxyribonuclease VII large subunit|nr:exodeoxyribonuclease VII large subunit [Ignavibacteria bacterium]